MSSLGPRERERAARETDRMVAEGAAGFPVYLVLFVLFALLGDYVTQHPVASLVFGGAIAAMTLARAFLHLRGTRLRHQDPASWRRRFGALTLASTGFWSGFATYVLAVDGLSTFALLILVASAGYSAVACTNFAPFAKLARGYHLVTLLPPAIASAYIGGPGGLALGGILLAQFIFQWWNGARRHRDHWQAMANTELLRRREEANALLAAALDHAAEAVEITDAQGRIQYVNPAFERVTGCSTAEAPGRHGDSLRPVDEAHPVPPELGQALSEGRFWSGSLTVRTKDGTLRHQEVSVSPVRDGEDRVTHHVWVRRDVTESRKLQARLMLSDRMASMGTLAAGVAHEINNPLASLLLDLDEIDRGLHGPTDRESLERLRPLAGEAREAAERVRDIVRQLRVFSRTDTTSQGPVRIDEVLDTAIRLATNEIRHRATLERDYGPELPAVHGEEGPLVQVFVNLLVNAAQALDRSTSETPPRITVRARMDEGGRVRVEVRDTGPGFPPDVRSKAFDPFFTTKPVGEGTGLGLAICHGTVTSYGGEIRLPDVSEGGVVQVLLPVGEGAPTPAVRASHRAPSAGPHRSLRILVVDDEVQVGRAVGRALRGHRVTVVADGNDAVERWKTGAFDVMLCDLMMPGFTGVDVYRALAELGHGDESRILFMTGGAFTEPIRDFVRRIDNVVLEKPFEARELRTHLQRLATEGRRSTG
ncbi:MAG: hybrid sensor histidine kinase/response regulator [Myxococcota bacterium]